MTAAMPIYDKNKQCDKCGNTTDYNPVTQAYVSPATSMYVKSYDANVTGLNVVYLPPIPPNPPKLEGERSDIVPEHILRTCRVCGWSWQERCLDWPITQSEEPTK